MRWKGGTGDMKSQSFLEHESFQLASRDLVFTLANPARVPTPMADLFQGSPKKPRRQSEKPGVSLQLRSHCLAKQT